MLDYKSWPHLPVALTISYSSSSTTLRHQLQAIVSTICSTRLVQFGYIQVHYLVDDFLRILHFSIA